jgi:hypothetical protein
VLPELEVGALRDAALEALGVHGDERARELLRHGLLAIEHDAGGWQASTGPVRAHRVTLGLDARALALLEHTPGVRDALGAALAAAIARRPGEALLDLREYWGLEEPARVVDYRGPVPPARVAREDADTVVHALGVYLQAAGERTAAALIEQARLELASGRSGYDVTLVLPRTAYRALGSDPHARAVLDEALRTLLQGPSRAPVRVARRAV